MHNFSVIADLPSKQHYSLWGFSLKQSLGQSVDA